MFNALLVPTSTLLVSGNEYLNYKDLEKVETYDWCKIVVNDIRDKATKWKNTAGKHSTPSVQGCVAFILIYYLDNLVCPQALENASSMPRASFFNRALLDKIVKAHRTNIKWQVCVIWQVASKEQRCTVRMLLPGRPLAPGLLMFLHPLANLSGMIVQNAAPTLLQRNLPVHLKLLFRQNPNKAQCISTWKLQPVTFLGNSQGKLTHLMEACHKSQLGSKEMTLMKPPEHQHHLKFGSFCSLRPIVFSSFSDVFSVDEPAQ